MGGEPRLPASPIKPDEGPVLLFDPQLYCLLIWRRRCGTLSHVLAGEGLNPWLLPHMLKLRQAFVDEEFQRQRGKPFLPSFSCQLFPNVWIAHSVAASMLPAGSVGKSS